MGLRFLAGPDFREGIRAQVVDKDRTPRWKPPTLAEVRPEQVERFFAPLGDRELDLGRELDSGRGLGLPVKESDHA